MHHFDIAHISQMGWNHRHPKRSVKNPANLDEVSCVKLRVRLDYQDTIIDAMAFDWSGSLTNSGFPSPPELQRVQVGGWSSEIFEMHIKNPLRNLRKTPIGRDGLSWKNNRCNAWNLLDLGIFRGAKKKTPGFDRPNSIHLKIYRSGSLRHPMWCSILLPFMLFQIVSLLASSWASTEGFERLFSGVKISEKCIVKPTGPMLCQCCWCINQGDWLYIII